MRWSLFTVLLLVAITRGQETCLSGDSDPYFMFGSKTAYVFATAKRGISKQRIHEIIGCKPIALWMLNRHGSHNPEANEINDLQKLGDLRNNIITNYQNGNIRNFNTRMCASDISILRNWQWNPKHNITFAGEVTSEAYMTTQQLAQGWKNKYPGVLTNNPDDYLFKYVDDKRSAVTFKAFTEGLFRASAENFNLQRETDEKLLRPYKFCKAWTTDVDENNATLTQKHTFESKQEFREMITSISHRLGFNWDIHKDIIMRIYQICRYNKAWDIAHVSPWCAAFTTEDLKLFEYAEDLETYYKYGYGTELNQKIGCTLVKDMMDFFKKHVDNEVPQRPKAMIHFNEAPMLLMTLAALGAERDSVPLTGDNYHTTNIQGRKWRTSTMAPFDANLGAVLYKCNPNGNFQVKEEYQVLFLENEAPPAMEECRIGLCDWSYVLKKLGDVADKCDLEICNGSNSINGLTALSVALLAFLAKYLL